MSSSPANHSASNPLWGGQYATGPAEIMTKINASIRVDKRLYAQDIRGSVAHAAMLAQQGIISQTDKEAITRGLLQIQEEIESGRFTFTDALEDIHMHIEHRLAEIIGEPAGRLHTARSRNDQVALDLRLFVLDACDTLHAELRELIQCLLTKAEAHAATLMPGFTHLQAAQPVTLGHHLLAYAHMFLRDQSRFLDARNRMNECPLGAAALAGTSFPIDRHLSAALLGFDSPLGNSLDAVSTRDFALEYLSAASICAVNLSRLAEEMVIWSSAQFSFIRFSDAFSTGSSIMPQKRNPDAAELVRGKTGRMFGNLMSLLVTMKALPLAYNKDMQEDKEPVFDTTDTLFLCLNAMKGMVEDFTVHADTMAQAAGSGYATATDLADWLVRKLQMPFRNAHHVTARIVKLASELTIPLEQLTLQQIQTVEPRITEDALHVLSATHSASSRTSFGGTAPENVLQMVKTLRDRLS